MTICPEERCTGCGACQSACPADCITLALNRAGDRVAEIDESRCTHCGKCSRICPVLHPPVLRESRTALAAYAVEAQVRQSSASGGAAAVLAQQVVESGGCAYGAAFTAPTTVELVRVDAPAQLPRLQGSKYVHAATGSAYRKVQADLKAGRQVLFTGTPCQVAGLYAYLGSDPPGLTTCDLVCHGVPSPGVWEDEARFIEGNKRRRLANVRFRNEVGGWKNSDFTAVYDDGTADSAPLFATGFGRAFGRALFLRQSCHDCQYTNLNRPGDFTLGDLWGLRPDEFPEQQHAGVSLLLVNTPHGSYLFDQLKLNCQPFPVERAVAGNPRLARPIGPAADRASFFASYAVEPFEEVRRQFFRLPSLPVRAAGKLLSPEAKAKLKAKLHR